MKPIGYWLNRTDQAFTEAMNAMLAEDRLTRLAWQILNVVQDSAAATGTEVHSVLAANATAQELEQAMASLLADGWLIRPEPTSLALTPDGRARLAVVEKRVGAFRQRSMAGITPDEYRTAVSVLERMTHNVEGSRS